MPLARSTRHRRTPSRATAYRATAALAASLVVSLVAGPTASHAAPNDVEQARRQVDALDHKASEATERYNVARNAMRDAERVLSQAQRRSSAQQEKLRKLQDSVGALAASAYRNGGVDRTLQLIFSEDPSAFLGKASALDALSTRQAAALRKVVEARRELRASQEMAVAQLAIVEAQRKVLAKEKAAIEGNLREARAVLGKLNASQRARLDRASRAGDPRELLGALPDPNPRAAKAVQYALKQLGDRYVWGAAGPDGFDCSGLTMMAWRQAGVSLPHSSSQQYAVGRKIPRSELQPGDLVFFYSPISHVGIYLGNGQIVDAPNSRKPVRITPITLMPYTGATRP
ncbi:MAG: NlpC/P60 family protein [Sporichthyaceae bacterium]